MSESSGKIYIPPYSGVRLIECREHFQLVPVPAVRVYFGYGKMKASDFATYPDEDAPSFHEFCESGVEIWIVLQLFRFEDGHEERGNCRYLRSPPATEDDARKRMREMEEFDNTTREELLAMAQCFRATEEDYQYIEDKHPNYQEEPDPSDTENYDVYHARLKVMEELQPKTVALIKIANATKDPVKRQFVEREAVQSYFAELPGTLRAGGFGPQQQSCASRPCQTRPDENSVTGGIRAKCCIIHTIFMAPRHDRRGRIPN